MYETIVNFDRNLFSLINSMNSPLMDSVMWWIADKFIWIPLYLLLAFFLYRKFGKPSLFMILFVALLIVISDQTSVLIKNTFMRERPCHDEALSFMVHIVNNKCGGKFGFVSSHAANTMAVFTYLLLLARNSSKKVTIVTAIWVALVGYSRIYLGVHFPADIFGGWLVGIVSAFVTYIIYRLIFESPQSQLQQ
jgi:undecaprenyl-diphosphatase